MIPRQRAASAATVASAIPLVRQFPTLESLPRAVIGSYPTPVQEMDSLAAGLWFKREDLTAEPLGGNKVRALEFLLGGVTRGDLVITVGAMGSTHALAAAVYARRLGARTLVIRWPQEMNETARRVSERIAIEADRAPMASGVVAAYARALVARVGGARWVPAGGSTPLGVLGQVNAALELIEQIDTGALPRPDRVVVPLGSGGTAAGLALGFAIAESDIPVIGVRVVPRIVANAARVRRLIARTAGLIERTTGERVSRPKREAVRIVHDFYGGSYGRATSAGADVAKRCIESTGIEIDQTYSAKALASAIALHKQSNGTTLFWLSFDGRWLRGDPGTAES